MSSILPAIENDVNTGKNFAPLRQVYNSIILGLWFKRKFRESFYRYYIDREKIGGIDLVDESIKTKIFDSYVRSFEKGVYDYIKKEYDAGLGKHVRRRYFSGGQTFQYIDIDDDTAVLSKPMFTGELTSGDSYAGSSITVADIDISARFSSSTIVPAFNRIIPLLAIVLLSSGFMGGSSGQSIEVRQGNVAEYDVKPFPMPAGKAEAHVDIIPNLGRKNTMNSILEKFSATYGGEIAFSVKKALAFAARKAGINNDSSVVDGAYVLANSTGWLSLYLTISDNPDGSKRSVQVTAGEVRAAGDDENAKYQRQVDSLRALLETQRNLLAQSEAARLKTQREEYAAKTVGELRRQFLERIIPYTNGVRTSTAGDSSGYEQMSNVMNNLRKRVNEEVYGDEAKQKFDQPFEELKRAIEAAANDSPDLFNGDLDTHAGHVRENAAVKAAIEKILELLNAELSSSSVRSYGGVDLKNMDVSVTSAGASSTLMALPEWDFRRRNGLTFTMRGMENVTDPAQLATFAGE